MENNNRRKLGTYQICLIALAIVMNVIGGQIALALRLPIYLQPGPARPLLPDPVYHLQHRADLLVQRRAGPDFSLRAPKGGQLPV